MWRHLWLVVGVVVEMMLPAVRPAQPPRPTVQYQTTVFSRDWLLEDGGLTATGSPWCDAGCIPNSSSAGASSSPPKPQKPPLFRAPSLVQLTNGSLIAISTERNGTAARLVAKASSDNGRSWSAKTFITGSNGWGDADRAHMPAAVLDSCFTLTYVPLSPHAFHQKQVHLGAFMLRTAVIIWI